MKILYLLFTTIVFLFTSQAQVFHGPNSFPIKVEQGWNLLSLPVNVSDSIMINIFPSSASYAFIYNNNYVIKDTLEYGIGFWIKYDLTDTIFVKGTPVLEDTITVNAGWNIIGSLSVPIAVNSIKSEPEGIIVSDIFSYVQSIGYRQSDTLKPASGYWVKVSHDGYIIFHTAVEINEKTCPGTPVVEYEGKTYNTIKISDQCWLKENLNVGTMIDETVEQSNNEIIEKYCYNNDTANCDVIGGLYQWNEALSYSSTEGARGLCPIGWHMPTFNEFQTLDIAVEGSGNALKMIGQGFEAGIGANTSGFSALMAGYHRYDNLFIELNYSTNFWSSTGELMNNAWSFLVPGNSNAIFLMSYINNNAFSIRCIKNNLPPTVPTNPVPSDSAIFQPTSLVLYWDCNDPDEDSVVYNVYFGKDNPPITLWTYHQTKKHEIIYSMENGTMYYWKIVAIDIHGDSTSGPIWKFKTTGGPPCPVRPTVNYEGKTYNTVQIENQCWLKENINTGIMISGKSPSNDGVIEKYCYNNDTMNCNTLGGLYKWEEAMQYSILERNRGVCPPGWRIPMLDEFMTLNTLVNNNANALKAIGQGYGPGAGTNTSGFSAILSGDMSTTGQFININRLTSFWNTTSGWDFSLFDYDNMTHFGYTDINLGYSVRCIMVDTLENHPPYTPSDPFPSDDTINQPLDITIHWTGGDPESDPIWYDIYFGNSNPPPKYSTNQTDTSFTKFNLPHGTDYYWRVVTRDNYGNETSGPLWKFSTIPWAIPCPGVDSIEYAEYIYHTVLIGDQCWLKENLNVGIRIDGAMLPAINDTIEKYCYNDDTMNCEMYGGLYIWDEAMHPTTISGSRDICPPGWHIPNEEYEYMAMFGVIVDIGGNSLKAIGQGTGEGAGTNITGFSALLAGARSSDNTFYGVGRETHIWTSTAFPWAMFLYDTNDYYGCRTENANYGYSVRCIKD